MAAVAANFDRLAEQTTETRVSAESIRQLYHKVQGYESVLSSLFILLHVAISTKQMGRKLRDVCEFASTYSVSTEGEKAHARSIVANLNEVARNLYELTDECSDLSGRVQQSGPSGEQRILRSMLGFPTKEFERQGCVAEDAAETMALASSEKFMKRLEHELQLNS